MTALAVLDFDVAFGLKFTKQVTNPARQNAQNIPKLRIPTPKPLVTEAHDQSEQQLLTQVQVAEFQNGNRDVEIIECHCIPPICNHLSRLGQPASVQRASSALLHSVRPDNFTGRGTCPELCSDHHKLRLTLHSAAASPADNNNGSMVVCCSPAIGHPLRSLFGSDPVKNLLYLERIEAKPTPDVENRYLSTEGKFTQETLGQLKCRC